MRYNIIAIGSIKKTFAKQGCEYYTKRLQNYAKVTTIEHKEANGSRLEVQAKEGAKLLQSVQGYSIALDEKGKTWRSQAFADMISNLELRSISQVSLIIGGAEGLSEDVKKRVDIMWSLSPLTFPHELARLTLLEQLYRAESIRAGHPYHRE